MTTLLRSAFTITLLLVAEQSLLATNPGDDGELRRNDLPQFQPTPFFNGERDVQLNLYTQNNSATPELILISDPSSAPSFDPKHPTRFVFHGWSSSGQLMDDFRKSYFESGLDFNVVIVDWKGIASLPYPMSMPYARSVGEWVAEVVAFLVQSRGLDLSDVYLIGHSLGAQVAAVVGNRLNGQVAQLVGLDAAAYLFGGVPDRDRLDPSDAKHVQCIHTNGGGIGWKDPLGHVDFFPEGGSVQAGCAFDFTGTCSHLRAVSLYVESILRKDFVGTMCYSYLAYQTGACSHNPKIVMGEWAPPEASGNYYLKTNSKSPYGLGDIGL